MRTIVRITAMAAALALGGCIEGETTHTLYLSPDGGVAWTTMERDVRSLAEDGAARRAEEAAYLAAALAGTGDVSAGLAALEASSVHTRVLRGERPFTILTEARFAAVDQLGLHILGALRVPGDVYTTTDKDVTTLHIHLDFREIDADSDAAADSPVVHLVDELSTYRIVLTEGRFVSAEGFTLDPDGRVARPIATADLENLPGRVVDLSLAWRR